MKPISSSSSFSRDFLALWKEIISYIGLTYTLLNSLVKQAAPKNLPADHPFQMDHDEFVITFDQGVDKFQKNLAKIPKHDLTDHELWCKNEEIENTEVVYRELSNAYGVSFASYSHILNFQEISSDHLEVSRRHLRRSLSDVERREYDHTEDVEARTLIFVDTNVQALNVVVDSIDKHVKAYVALLQQLERERDDLEHL